MSQEALFAVNAPGVDKPGDIEQSILDTIQELDDAGMYVGKVKATCVALTHSARAVDRQLSTGKLTVAATQMTKQILESLEKLPEPHRENGGVFDTLATVIQTMTQDALRAPQENDQ